MQHRTSRYVGTLCVCVAVAALFGTAHGEESPGLLGLAQEDFAQAELAQADINSSAPAADLDRAGAGAFDEPFAQGTWTFQTYGSATMLDKDHGNIYTAHVGGGYHIVDDFSISLEAVGGWVDSRTDDDGYAGGLDLLLRWHFAKADNNAWSLYVDGGAGFQEATTDFPSDSSHNFRPQLGFGGTYRLGDGDVRLMGGARWLHISNAGTTDGNDGGDWAQLYLGVMVPF